MFKLLKDLAEGSAFKKPASVAGNAVSSAEDNGVCRGDVLQLAWSRFVDTFSLRPNSSVDHAGLTGDSADHLLQGVGWQLLVRGFNDAVVRSAEDAWFRVLLNDVAVQLPRYTMRTMRHCVHVDLHGLPKIYVETGHANSMSARFGSGGLFLDIGAATGAMTVPYAMTFHDRVKIIAFEPSPRARGHLEATLSRNGVTGVTVLPYALSDRSGSSDFFELPLETDLMEIPWLSEGSRLSVGEQSVFPGDQRVSVEVKTLDEIANEMNLVSFGNVVIKIDVEGFEENVLRGGLEFISKAKPFLSIDIHEKPGTHQSTMPDVRVVLEPLHYRFTEMGHVLLCEPGQTQGGP